MRIDCHFHTTLYSCCSFVSPEIACEIAIARGLDALIFTEHGVYWEKERLATLQARYPKVRLYSGIEIALSEGYHVVAFGARFLDHPVHHLSLPQLNRLVAPRRDDIFLFVAHAFRYQSFFTQELQGILKHCDGMEMRSINILRGQALIFGPKILSENHTLYESTIQAHGLVPLFNSDGHDEESIGLISNELQGVDPPANEVVLAHLFKEQTPIEFQDHEHLSRHILLSS
ncbi:PHP domain-containing protein [Desulfonatronum thioautotrophicum]|uniref:PHP domain-containing protein n=1 Tax=Desulfonatronum thioautotrophicum TaxID=617001 RepID=UPI0005EB66D1|nr:PHP domain-containing protein [Desulfonatronum thioautotrophicum]